jgi:hypothetical protein
MNEVCLAVPAAVKLADVYAAGGMPNATLPSAHGAGRSSRTFDSAAGTMS